MQRQHPPIEQTPTCSARVELPEHRTLETVLLPMGCFRNTFGPESYDARVGGNSAPLGGAVGGQRFPLGSRNALAHRQQAPSFGHYCPGEDHTWSPGVGILCWYSQFRVQPSAEIHPFFEIHLTHPEEPGHKSPFALTTLSCLAGQWKDKPVKAPWTSHFEKVVQNCGDIWAIQLTSVLIGLGPKHQSEVRVASLL